MKTSTASSPAKASVIWVPMLAIWMIGPKMAPVGYVCVSFGWSIELGGMDAMIDELWIREKVRGRGMGTEALEALKAALGEAGVKALHLEGLGDGATRLYERAGFRRRPHALLTRYAREVLRRASRASLRGPQAAPAAPLLRIWERVTGEIGTKRD